MISAGGLFYLTSTKMQYSRHFNISTAYQYDAKLLWNRNKKQPGMFS